MTVFSPRRACYTQSTKSNKGSKIFMNAKDRQWWCCVVCCHVRHTIFFLLKSSTNYKAFSNCVQRNLTAANTTSSKHVRHHITQCHEVPPKVNRKPVREPLDYFCMYLSSWTGQSAFPAWRPSCWSTTYSLSGNEKLQHHTNPQLLEKNWVDLNQIYRHCV